MSIHTRFVGAFDAIILSLTAAVNIAMLLTLLVPSFDPPQIASRRGTVTIQQLAVDDTANIRRL